MRHIATHARGLRRRDFLGILGAGSVAAVMPASGWGSLETTVSGGYAAATYDPNAKFDVAVHEVEFRRNRAGRTLMARVYQPSGPGPFPAVLDLHGGAWNAKDRRAEEPMDRALAASGLLVVAIDLTLAPEAPYPACVQDANYGVRWLKWKAPSWNGSPSKIGIYGSSSGGHVAELLAMRPTDPRYNAIPLAEAPQQDASVAYVAMRSPISDPFARFKNAESLKRDAMIANHKTFFVPWETIFEANPQQMLERHEKVTLVPMLIMQGALDDNVLPVRAGEIRGDLQSRRRRVRVSRVRGKRARVGRHTRAADGSCPRHGEGVHRAPVEVPVEVRRVRTRCDQSADMTPEEERCAEAKKLQRIDAAFLAGDLEALRAAVDDPAAIPNGRMPDTVGNCLVYAIYHSPLAFIRTLLDIGADPNLPVDDGFPPIIAALMCGAGNAGREQADRRGRDHPAAAGCAAPIRTNGGSTTTRRSTRPSPSGMRWPCRCSSTPAPIRSCARASTTVRPPARWPRRPG